MPSSPAWCPHEPDRLAAAWHAVFTREVLRGASLPLLVAWTHPAGRACFDLPGGPSPHAIVLALPATPASLRPRIAHLHATQTPVYVAADVFTLPPPEQAHLVLTAALEQQLDASPLETRS